MARRKPRPSDDGGADRWLGTYGDMITLLMAFFVMLYAISQVDDIKFLALVRGLDVFGNTTNVDGLLESGPALLEEGAAADRPDSGDQVGEFSLEPLTPPPPPDEPAEPVDEVTPASIDLRDEVREVRRKLRGELERVGLPGELSDVRADPRGVVISVSSDDVLFPIGSAELTRRGRQIVRAVSRVVDDYRTDVVIEGHTDNLPLRRPGYSNWNLSTDRAVAVVERLADRHDVARRRLVATGYSEYRPLVPNTSRARRARNRRVDVLLRMDGGEA